MYKSKQDSDQQSHYIPNPNKGDTYFLKLMSLPVMLIHKGKMDHGAQDNIKTLHKYKKSWASHPSHLTVAGWANQHQPNCAERVGAACLNLFPGMWVGSQASPALNQLLISLHISSILSPPTQPCVWEGPLQKLATRPQGNKTRTSAGHTNLENLSKTL